MSLPNSSGSKATFRVSSEEAESPLPNSSGDLRTPSELVVQRLSAPLPTTTTTTVHSDIPDYVTERMQPLIDKKNTLSSQFSEQDVNDLVLFYKENIVFTYLFNMFQLDKKSAHNLMQKIKLKANKLDKTSPTNEGFNGELRS